MLLELSDLEVDYVYRLLVSRPMAEVEPIVMKLRQQVVAQQSQPMPGAQALAGNGLDKPELLS
jgi:hypothetical protein